MSARLQRLDAAIDAAEDALWEAIQARDLALFGWRAWHGEPPLSGRNALLTAWKIVRESQILGTPAQDIVELLEERFEVRRWQIGFIDNPHICIRVAGVQAGSPLGLDTVLAVWVVNATKALREGLDAH